MSKSSSNKWITNSVGGIILLGLVTSFIYDLVKDVPFLSTISFIFKSIWSFLYQTLTYELKILWVVLAIGVYYITKKNYRLYKKSIIPELPRKYELYKSDSFTNWDWKWDWEWDRNNKKWIISSLWPYCRKCKIKLLDKSTIIEFAMECPKCRQRFDSRQRETDDIDGVKTIIYDNIDRLTENYNSKKK